MFHSKRVVTARTRPNNESVPRYGSDGDFSFSIHRLPEAFKAEQPVDKPHRHAHFEMIWITAGDAICHIDQVPYICNQYTIYLIPPGHTHSLIAGEDADGFVISFTREFILLSAGTMGGRFYMEMLMDDACLYQAGNEREKADLLHVLNCLEREFRNYSFIRQSILSGFLRVFFSYLKCLPGKLNVRSEHTKELELTNGFFISLEKHFLKKRMVAEYARELSVSSLYLNEVIKRVSGGTVSYHIQQRLVLEARRLAIYTNASMKEIACLLGFDDIAYFSKFFKAFCGMNFRKFKKNIRESDIAGNIHA